MNVTQSGQLTIFHLDNAEFDDAEIKNRCLIQAKTPYIAYVRNSEVEDRELFAELEEEETPPGRREERLVVYISGNAAEIRQDYTGALELVSCSIDAILFPKKQIQKAGAFNAKLSAKTDFEFLCRIVRETGQCVVRRAKHAANVSRGNDHLTPNASVAEALAYMIRHHLDHLHALGMTERIFSLFCEYAQAENIFPVFQQKLNLFLSDQREYERLARQTAPFVVLRGDDTCGGVLQGFADDLADGLEYNGQAVVMVDENFTQHEKLQNMVCKGVVGFQSKALEIDFFRKIHGPKFQFWFDNPLHFENVLRNLPEEYFILCQDANYAASIREYYHTQNAIQFPPGGRTPRRISGWEGGGQGGVQEICMRERPYDIIFMGNYFEDAAETLAGFEREFYDYMLLHPCETFEQGLSELRESIDEDSFIKISCSLKPACRMVIGHFRNAVVSTILGAGFTLHVYGDSWRNYQGAGREHLKIHPYASVEESLEELGKAKIGLNIMSWHKAGMTERIANIMLSGAVCLTEETVYLQEHMREGEEIVTFRLDCLEELPDKVKNLLEDAGRREKIVANAYRRAVEEYTWERRAEELIELSGYATGDVRTVFAAAQRVGSDSSENAIHELPPAGKNEDHSPIDMSARCDAQVGIKMSAKKRLVLFRGELDTLNLFSDQLRQGFLELGYEIFDFDLQQSAKSLGLLHEYMQAGPITAMIAFNSLFFGMTTPSGENLWEVLGIPCVNILVDHPYWYHNILMRMPATGIVLCIDRNHMDYVNRFYPNIPSNGFLAHGGTSLGMSHKPVRERAIDVLYAGSLYADHIQQPDLSGWRFPAKQVCDRSIGHLLAHPEETMEHVIEKQLQLAGVSLSDEELRRFISSCVFIERIVSSHYRERIVSSVARAGISLKLYGDGWSECDWIGLPNVHYGGRVAPEEILAMMEDSRIVLNTLPWFRDGSHERVFNAMLCGAVAVSETSRYLEETIPSDAWVSYDLSAESLSALPQRIADLLADEKRLQEIASAGQELALSAHTWKARAQELHEDLISSL